MIQRYRAWDKASHAWRHDIYVGLDGLAKDLSRTGEEPFELPLDNVILMQSTGLFDKNGKEIFEADILKCTSFDGCLWCETVSWDSAIAGFATHQNGYDATPIEYITDSKAITIEIIGNVYQNPELVEDE